MFLNCGEQFRRRYVEGDIIAPKAAMIRGTAVHHAHRRGLEQKIVGAELPSVEECESIVSDAIDGAFAGNVTFNPDESIQATKDRTKEEALKLVRLDREELMPKIEPVAVEEEITITIPGISRNVKGVLDVAEQYAVRDLKTGKTPSQDAAWKSSQLSLYGLLFEKKYGSLPQRYILDNLVNNKVATLITQESTRDEADLQVFLNRLSWADNQINQGNFHPANDQSWICSEAYCGYWTTCAFGGKGRTKRI